MMANNLIPTGCTVADDRAPGIFSTKLRYTVAAVLMATVGSGCSTLQTPATDTAGGQNIREVVVERYSGPGISWHETEVPQLHYNSKSRSRADSRVRYVGTLASRWRPVKSSVDQDADGVLDIVDRCLETTDFVTVDQSGCGLFDAVLDNVIFTSGSWLLTTQARTQLAQLAQALQLFPEARIEVRAHTDSRGGNKANLLLSAQRADAAYQYLLSRGVHSPQLQAIGLGEDFPLVRNNTRKGRERNRRVEVVTLPDRDAGSFILARNMTLHNMVIGKHDLDEEPRVKTHAQTQMKSIAAEIAKNNRLRTPVIVDSSEIEPSSPSPELFAALPFSQQASERFENTNSPLNISPLPRPGIAPEFSHNGVLSNVSFDSGSSMLSDSAQEALEPLLSELLEQVSVSIVVMAHTDDQGDPEENTRLSVRRAQAVVNFLIGQGIEDSRLSAEGYGESLPLVQNISETNREHNRRIEIRVRSSNPAN